MVGSCLRLGAQDGRKENEFNFFVLGNTPSAVPDREKIPEEHYLCIRTFHRKGRGKGVKGIR